MPQSHFQLGDFIIVNDEPGSPKILYGVAIEVNDDVVGLWVKNLADTYGKATTQLILSGAEVITACGDRLRYLGPFQDTGDGNPYFSRSSN